MLMCIFCSLLLWRLKVTSLNEWLVHIQSWGEKGAGSTVEICRCFISTAKHTKILQSMNAVTSTSWCLQNLMQQVAYYQRWLKKKTAQKWTIQYGDKEKKINGRQKWSLIQSKTKAMLDTIRFIIIWRRKLLTCIEKKKCFTSVCWPLQRDIPVE